MNNDLEQFSEERLKEISELTGAYEEWSASQDEIHALACIALSVKQAKPVGIFVKVDEYIDTPYISWLDGAYRLSAGDKIYTTPQPAHTERVIKITQSMLDAAVADYCTTGKYTVENIPYELRRQVEFEAECTFKAMLAAAHKPESE